MTYRIDSVLTGKAPVFGARGEPSAIAKTPATGPRAVTFLGIAGDEQAELSVHGGPDKAIHHYPRDHYAFWDDALGDHALLASPGAFGENISTSGPVEDAACIGDRSRLWTEARRVGQTWVAR